MTGTVLDRFRVSGAPTHPVTAWGLLPAFLISAGAVVLFAIHLRPHGYVLLVAGVIGGFLVGRELGRSLLLIALGQAIISTIDLEADLSNAGMARFTVALSLAVLVPLLTSRYLFRDNVIRFPIRTGQPWSRAAWAYLIFVVVAGYLILPWYFLSSGSYQNWPPVDTTNEVIRLLIGVNAVGTWDELFFICIVFALYKKHFPLWQANILQAMVFVSFLWELGYRSWGPALTIPFALIQGATFAMTKSFAYVLIVHLLFDVVVFMALVHGHRPDLFDVFLTAP